MALVLKDRVVENASAPGTGTVTLLGAVTGYQSFATIGDGNTTFYTIADVGGNNWEVGIGTYTSSGTTLSRDTVISNSLGTTAKINFSSGTQTVFVTYPAEQSVNLDASGNATALGTVASATLTNATGLPLTTGTTGILPLAKGGSNANLTAIAGGAVYSTGSALAITAAGTAGQVFTSNGASAPTWQTNSAATADDAYFLSFMMG